MPASVPILGLALAIFIPLSPAADQAELTILIAMRVDALVEIPGSPYDGRAWRWSGAECQSLLEVAQSDDNLFTYTIDWTSRAIVLTGDGKAVKIGGLTANFRRPVTAAVTLRFADDRSAETARRAFTRLQAACRPRR